VSDISSAGMAGATPGYGKTCRQDVLRGVDVPVVPGAAGRARPVPPVQAQRSEDMPARRACLRRRVPPVDHDQVPPVPGRLVLEHGPEGSPPAVRDRLRHPAVADHVLHGEIFHDDHVVVADQVGGGLVQEVGAGGADFAVGAGGLGLGFGAVGGPGLAARRSRCRGFAIRCPSLVTAKSVIPRSTPAPRPVAGRASGLGMSTANETYQRPHGSRGTVTVVGSMMAGSMPGQDQANASGVSIFARYRCPSRHRNPDRVYSAHCRPFRDLNRGYRARWAKNAV
jgi:hypothetical protein